MVKRDSYLPLIKKFIENEPHEAASALEELDPTEACQIFIKLPLKDCSLLVPYLSTDFSGDLLKLTKPEFLAKLIEILDGPYSAKLLRILPEDKRKSIISLLSQEKKISYSRIIHLSRRQCGPFNDHQRHLFLYGDSRTGCR